MFKKLRWGCYSGLPGVLAYPPTHQTRKIFLRGKTKCIKGAGKWMPILGTQTSLRPQPPPSLSMMMMMMLLLLLLISMAGKWPGLLSGLRSPSF